MIQPVDELEKILSSARALHEKSSFVYTEQKSRFRRLVDGLQGLGILGRLILTISRFLAVIIRPFNYLCGKYLQFWNWFVYKKDKNGWKSFSKTRASFLSGLTIFFLLSLTPTWMGEAIRYSTFEPIGDGLMMAATLNTEVYYLNSTEEIDPFNNIHSVRGCHTNGECSEKDAAYFHVKPRLSHDVWKFLKYGNPIYVPDHVIAPIAPGVNKCAVTYYGYRMTTSWIARLLRSAQVYPVMLETSCTHIGSA